MGMDCWPRIHVKSENFDAGVRGADLFQVLVKYDGGGLIVHGVRNVEHFVFLLATNLPFGAAAYQLGNTSSRTITEVKQR